MDFINFTRNFKQQLEKQISKQLNGSPLSGPKNLIEPLNVLLYLNLYLNFKKSVLGCIDTYRGVQRRIFQHFASSTRRIQTRRPKSPKITIFRRDQKCRRAAAFAAYTETRPYQSSMRGANQEEKLLQIFRIATHIYTYRANVTCPIYYTSSGVQN